ncbi:aminodeoxychorismate/anthranilate synthase component II [Gracilibacillus salitolerans]|uniref:Aminodeoxychorismate/anthranilate synthase component II n=1 Tax=Gracilibacillus salitolerans TaxID=2663022 RepID=A0A5Q2TTK2_9BACI|nr:aminodeoxychorismate/anthranilate synthase component II [Gracilibacillus salitolerans]QGH36980.1 aminodeoxychorismate/anthranilate synthase component II [Gracilibacillus salitolerans]
MVIIIDNYDSFTYNLVQYYRQLTDDVVVFRNDNITMEKIKSLNPDLIVLSPGPGSPEDQKECISILDYFYTTIPIFGVCLGMQIIVHYFGGQVTKALAPMHGKVSKIKHNGKDVFDSLPNDISVTRYHSLIAKKLPENELVTTAITYHEEIMAVKHKQYRVEGIQFHPEAILTEYGFNMIQNSYKQAIDGVD